MRFILLPVVFVLLAADEKPTAELLTKARDALAKRDTDKALKLATEAVKISPDSAAARFTRGMVHEAMGKHEEAVADFTEVLKLDPRYAEALDHRGSELFKLGKIAESLADFDAYIKVRPEAANGHWKRGISLYYAARYDDGRKQFEGYEKVDTNDVENAVWHFLCAAKGDGLEKARKGILKIGKDRRVPMMQVYDLYKGEIKPDDVLKAVDDGDVTDEQRSTRLFYAHLYLGLYHDATGDAKKAREHMALAAEKYRIGHYMGDVAKVHLDLLRKRDKEK